MIKNNPKILIYHNRLLPISETFIYNQSIRLSRYDAYFLGSKLQKGNRVSLPPDRVILINSGGFWGICNEILFKLFGFIPRNALNKIKKLEPVLIHAHFVQSGAIVLPLVKKLKVPFLLSILGSDVTQDDQSIKRHSVSGKIYVKRRRRLINAVDQIIVPSHFLKEKAIKRGFESKKIVIIHHGVDIQQFSPNRSSVEYGNILFVGRLIPVKGVNYLIEAVKIVREYISDIRLTLLGDGPMRDIYELQAQKELGDGFEFLGAQSQDVVKKYLEKAYLFCAPSVVMSNGQTETFGVVFAEAQAMGVPIVSFASGGIPEVVQNGITGFLVKERDEKALADAMLKLLQDKELHAKMSVAARKRAELYFDLKKQNDELEYLYDRMISDPRS